MAKALRRPSVFLIASLWAGIQAGSVLGFSFLVLAILVLSLALGLPFVRRRRLHFTLVVVAFFVMGVLRSPDSAWNRTTVPPELQVEPRFPVIVEVAVPWLVGECREHVTAFVGTTVVGHSRLTGNRVVLRGMERIAAPPMRQFTVVGRFRAPRSRLNPYGIDGLSRNLRHGTIGEIDVESVVADPVDGRGSVISRFRRRLVSLVDSVSSDQAAGMLKALLLGERSDLSPDLGDLMIRAGTYHVLAISGLHVGIVVLILTAFLSSLRLGRRWRIIVAVVCVLSYVVFTGARPSAQRAWVFFMLIGVCRLLQWKIDYPNCVGAAGTVLLLVSPHLAWDVGFKLSLAAVFGITLLVPQLAGPGKVTRSLCAKIKRYVITGLLASFSAQAFTLPILLYHFGRVSLIGPLSNLVVLPLVTLIVASGIEAVMVMPFSRELASVLLRGASAFAAVTIGVTGFLTGLVDPLVYTGKPGIWKVVVYTAALTYLGLLRPRMARRVKISLLISLCAFLIVPVPWIPKEGLEATFLYVGNGDACFIEMPGGKTLLVDAGACSQTFDAGRAYVLPFLAMKGVPKIDAVLISHPHNDHYGGVATLMGSFDVGEILIGATRGEAQYERLLEDARRQGIEVTCIGRGDTLHFGEVSLEVFHPPRDTLWEADTDANTQSVVSKLVYGDHSILFTGDVTPAVQKGLVKNGHDLASDILKVPHHGAPEAVDISFLRAVGAGFAVVSVGSRFSSHPCPATIKLLESFGTQVLTTISNGAVTVTSDGHWSEVGSEAEG
jgi:competence protein ComEC